MTILRPVYIVSACLVGLCTRYDGRTHCPDPRCMHHLQGSTWIPVCPEQLGGLATPRTAADLTGGNGTDVLAGKATVINKHGVDVTRPFIRGAQQVLAIARSQDITAVLLKSRSPSCGVNEILGVTAALLAENSYILKEF